MQGLVSIAQILRLCDFVGTALAIAAIAEMCLWHTIVSVSTAQLLDKSTRYRHNFVIFAQRSIASQAGFSFIESSRFSFEWANILRQVV